MTTVGERILELIDEWIEGEQRFELLYYGETEPA